MSLTINKLIAAIMVVIFIFTVGIVLYLYTGDPIGTLNEAFEQVTTTDALTREEKTEYTLEAYNKFTSNIDNNCNEKETDKCFCYSQSQGSITGESYILIQNSADSSTVSLINDEQTYLQNPEQKDYAIGLFTLREVSGSWYLECTYPSEFFIVGKDVRETPYVNQWRVIWKLDGLEEEGYGFYGDTYYGGFSGNKEYTTGEIEELKSVNYIYKIDEQHICLLTNLIEEEDQDYAGQVSSHHLSEITAEGFIFKDPKKSDIIDFFTGDDTRYCNKDYAD